MAWDKRTRRYFQLIAERDYLDFCIRQMFEQYKKLQPIEKMINQATGFDKERLKEAKSLLRMINRRQKEIESFRTHGMEVGG